MPARLIPRAITVNVLSPDQDRLVIADPSSIPGPRQVTVTFGPGFADTGEFAAALEHLARRLSDQTPGLPWEVVAP